MFKKFISFLISIFIILALTPIRSGAVDNYPVWVEGIQVTSINNHGEGWSYTSTGFNTGILRLTNADLHSPANGTDDPNMPYNSAIGFGIQLPEYSGFDLTIILEGENHLQGNLGISAVNSSLIITGDGSLDVDTSNMPIWAYRDITIQNTEVNVTSRSGGGIYAGCNIRISNGSLVTAEINKDSEIIYGTITASGNSQFGMLDLQDGLYILDPFRGGIGKLNDYGNAITIVNPDRTIATNAAICR